MTGEEESRGLDFLELARTRRSIRRYRPDPVPEELLLRVLEAARWAPSAVNSQPWHFVVVRDPGRRSELAARARVLGFIGWKHLAQAPVVVAVVGDPRGNRYYVVDCALAGMNLLLQAHALGLGTCWVGGFGQEQVRGPLGVPPHLEVVGLVTMGWPAETPAPPPRLPLERLVSWEVYDPAVAASWRERLERSGLYSLRKRVRAYLRRRPKS
ncbi:MAG: nitroreductase family protein [Firmicutes bacterium]|nr:nitroreductase family protein [Bacillota bacterium]